MLFGYGASAINPYLVNEIITYHHKKGIISGITRNKAIANYNKAIAKGILKVMNKIGISTLHSYRGSQIFEALGLRKKFVDKYFNNTPSRIEGVGLYVLEKEISYLQNYNGSIDDLIYNLNETRTWLYITNQKQWISNSIWVETVKNIENKLSEEIHLSLMQKFVDKNKSEIIQNLNISKKNISLTDNRYVKIKDEKIGVIKGFKIFFDEK